MPYGRCVIYSFTGDDEELATRSREGVLPILRQQHGYIAYGAIVKDGQVVSISAWESEADARAADAAARGWVQENTDLKLVNSYFGDYAWLDFAQQ
jgi:hypothetical protein